LKFWQDIVFFAGANLTLKIVLFYIVVVKIVLKFDFVLIMVMCLLLCFILLKLDWNLKLDFVC